MEEKEKWTENKEEKKNGGVRVCERVREGEMNESKLLMLFHYSKPKRAPSKFKATCNRTHRSWQPRLRNTQHLDSGLTSL
jgi:hypothetical protein